MTTTTDQEQLITPDEREIVARVFLFAEVLRAADLMSPDEDEYFERPWKWQPEYAAWCRAGKPMPPEDLTPDLSWERFVRTFGEQP